MARHVVYRVDVATGALENFAGLSGVSGSEDGIGSAARFHEPAGLAFDHAGNLYVAEREACRIRRIEPNGAVTTLAGEYGAFGSVDGVGAAARFFSPVGLAFDASASGGRLVVADSLNSRIRTINTSTAVVANLAGPVVPTRGADNGLGAGARFNAPRALARDVAGNLFVADRGNHVVRRISPSGQVTTVAGKAGEPGSLNGVGEGARFNEPEGIAVSADGAILYVSENGNHTIRRLALDAQGVATVTTLAGAAGLTGFGDGTGGLARFNQPRALALGPTGDLFVADFGNNRIRRVTPGGLVSTFGAAVPLAGPVGLAVDAKGDVFVADSINQVVQRIASDETGAVFAGVYGSNGYIDGDPLAARFFLPHDVSLDGEGHLYVADYGNHVVRRIIVNPDGTAGAVQTLAGTDNAAGAADGVFNAARFRNPQGILAVSADELYVADTGNNTVRLAAPVDPPVITSPLTASGTVAQPFVAYRIEAEPFVVLYEAAGLPTGLALNPANGVISGTPQQAGTFPVTIKGIALGGDAVETLTLTIAKGAAIVSLEGLSFPYDGTPKSPAVTTTPPGLPVTLTFNGSLTSPSAFGSYDLVASIADANYQGSASATFSITAPTAWRVATHPAAASRVIAGMAFAPDGTLYLANPERHVILRRTPGGVETVFAGTVNEPGFHNATGGDARFDTPSAVAVDAAGNVYVADTGNHGIRKITTDGVVSFVAGGTDPSEFDSADGVGSQARFYLPHGLAIGPDGSIYIADLGNARIRRLAPNNNQVSTVVWPGPILQPRGVAVDADGTLYVSEDEYHQVTRFTNVGGGVYAFAWSAGMNGIPAYQDGATTAARFNRPQGIALGGDGALYVADTGNRVVRRVSASGVVTTVAGLPGVPGSAIGFGGDARFNEPTALAVSPQGKLLLSDIVNRHVRELSPPPVVPTFTSELTLDVVEGKAVGGFTLTATGSPTSFAASGLPAGLTLNAATGTIAGSPVHSGVYAVHVSVTNELTSVQAVMTVFVRPPALEDWRSSRFSLAERADPVVSGWAADPDGDGLPNLIEYVFDRDPKVRDAGALTFADSQGHLTLSFERRRSLPSGALTVESSTDLAVWTDSPTAVEIVAVAPIDERRERVTVRTVAPLGSISRQFLRLRADAGVLAP